MQAVKPQIESRPLTTSSVRTVVAVYLTLRACYNAHVYKRWTTMLRSSTVVVHKRINILGTLHATDLLSFSPEFCCLRAPLRSYPFPALNCIVFLETKENHNDKPNTECLLRSFSHLSMWKRITVAASSAVSRPLTPRVDRKSVV